MEFNVTWEMEVTADTEKEAAQIARQAQIRPGTQAVVFDVWNESGEVTRVDLLDDETAGDH
jgi:hypothetical protein